jgi:hypothetical protein
MGQGTFQPAFPALTPVMQIRAAPGFLASRVNLHPLRCADDAHHLPFWHHDATADAGALRNMFHALNWYPGHLSFNPQPCLARKGAGYEAQLPLFFTGAFAAALVLLAPNDFTAYLIKFQLNALFLDLLAFLLARAFLVFRLLTGRLKDLRFQLE